MEATKKYLYLSFITVLMQYYCYAIFGLSSAALAQKFFYETNNSLSSYIKFFTVFALGTIARPLGAGILSIIGDRYGKTYALTLAGLMAGLANFLIAILPGQEIAGIWAIFGLIFCRMLILAGISGEIDGIRLYLTEKWPDKSYLVSGVISASTQAGVLLAAILVYVSSAPINFYDWQINFIIGGIFGALVVILRKQLSETSSFIKYKNSTKYQNLAHMPLLVIFKQYKWLILSLVVINGAMGAGYHTYLIFFSIYMKDILQIKLFDSWFMYNILAVIFYLLACFASFICIEIFKNIRIQIIYSILLSLLIAIANIFFITLMKPYLVVILNFAAIFLLPFSATTIPIYIQQKITYGIRYRLLSISHSLGSVILSASSPVAITLIYRYTNLKSSPYLYFALILVIMLLSFMYVEKILKNNTDNEINSNI